MSMNTKQILQDVSDECGLARDVDAYLAAEDPILVATADAWISGLNDDEIRIIVVGQEGLCSLLDKAPPGVADLINDFSV